MPFSKHKSIPNTAVIELFSAYKGVPIPSTLSTPKGIEPTFDTYPKSFTQNRFQLWNLILLFFCLGTMSSFLLCFDSLSLNLINWLTGWNCLWAERQELSVLHDSLRVIGSSRQEYSISFYIIYQLLVASTPPSLSSPTNPPGIDGGLQGG